MSNEDVYHKIHEKRLIWTTIRERRKKWMEHFLRNNAWVTFIIEEKIEGNPGRERSKQSYMKQIMLGLGKGFYKKLKEVTMDREEWRNMSLMNQSMG